VQASPLAGKELPGNAEHTMTSGQGKVQLLSTIGLVMCLFSPEPCECFFRTETAVAPLTSDQVVQRMVERNEQRAQALESYRGTRIYISNITDCRVRAPHWLWQ